LIVHKFGGSSLADAAGFERVGDIVMAAAGSKAVVVSAMAGVTNDLVSIVEMAMTRDEAYRDRLRALRGRHRDAAEQLLGLGAVPIVRSIERDFGDLEDVLRAAWILRDASPGTFDMVTGYGEIWSARLFSALLISKGAQADWLNARTSSW